MKDLPSPSEREKAIGAMARVCAERGYLEVSVEDVIRWADIDREAFDRHFDGSKEECMAATVKAIMSETMSVVASSYSADRSEWDSGIAGLKAILELMAANPSFAYIAYIASRQMAPELRDVRESGVAFLGTMIDRLRSYSPDSAPPPPTAAAAAFGGAEAVVRREIAAGRTERLTELLPTLVYGATVPFLGQEEALRLARRGRRLAEKGERK